MKLTSEQIRDTQNALNAFKVYLQASHTTAPDQRTKEIIGMQVDKVACLTDLYKEPKFTARQAFFETVTLFVQDIEGAAFDIIGMTMTKYNYSGDERVNVSYHYPIAPTKQVSDEIGAKVFDFFEHEIKHWCDCQKCGLGSY